MESEKIGKKLHVYYMDDMGYTIMCVPREDKLDFDIYKHHETELINHGDGKFVKKKNRQYKTGDLQNPNVGIENIQKAQTTMAGFVNKSGGMNLRFQERDFVFPTKKDGEDLGELIGRVFELSKKLL